MVVAFVTLATPFLVSPFGFVGVCGFNEVRILMVAEGDYKADLSLPWIFNVFVRSCVWTAFVEVYIRGNGMSGFGHCHLLKRKALFTV